MRLVVQCPALNPAFKSTRARKRELMGRRLLSLPRARALYSMHALGIGRTGTCAEHAQQVAAAAGKRVILLVRRRSAIRANGGCARPRAWAACAAEQAFERRDGGG